MKSLSAALLASTAAAFTLATPPKALADGLTFTTFNSTNTPTLTNNFTRCLCEWQQHLFRYEWWRHVCLQRQWLHLEQLHHFKQRPGL